MTPVDYSIGVLPWAILGAGLLVGLALIPLFRRLHARTDEHASDIALERTDLEAARDEAMARLHEPDLTDEDRRLLELQAARAMQRLDALPTRATPPGGSEGARTEPAVERSTRRGFWAKHPALGGALLGGGIVSLVAVLIVLAMGDAAPREDANPMAAAPAATEAAPPGSASQPPLPPFLQAQVDQMRGALAEEPEDIPTRRRLALTLLSGNQAFDAFQEASAVLRMEPEDAEALYVVGFVRYLMGQPEGAIESFDRAIASKPSYSQPWLVKGLIQLQLGQRSDAIETWEAGLDASGGSESRLEHLIREARTDKSVEEILANPPG